MRRFKQEKAGIMIFAMCLLPFMSALVVADDNPEQTLFNWSQEMVNKLNLKMDRKLNQIVMEAQILQSIKSDNEAHSIYAEKDVDCIPVDNIPVDNMSKI